MGVLVTGANGFLGRVAVQYLCEFTEHRVSCAVRSPISAESLSSSNRPVHVVGEISAETDWRSALKGIHCVVHCAARVHVMKEALDAEELFTRVNVDGTLQLAEQAAASGVKRFIFISTIKVNGESSAPHHPFTPDAQAMPEGAYAVSKYEAEQALRALSERTGMELVIIRPPLVYGPGVKANFLSMVRWLSKGIPLPLGAVDNKRSLVYVYNLVDLIKTCIDHPRASGQVFLVSDDEDLSIHELLRRTGSALGKRVRLMKVPVVMLRASARLVGKDAQVSRLCDSLSADISKTKRLLGWTPPVSVDKGLSKTVAEFRETY